MDMREIKKLIALMDEHSLSRLEVEEEGRRFLLEKKIQDPLALINPMALQNPVGSGAGSQNGVKAVEDTRTFNSPMVGTFYRAASPDSEPFTKPGERITQDSVLCIIEAMKVFNEIKAEMTGTIVEVLAENSEAVEYNQPLFLIKPD